jgi:hypothetical protein
MTYFICIATISRTKRDAFIVEDKKKSENQ